MVWYGMVWYGIVCSTMVWYGMTWCGMVLYGMTWYDMVRYGWDMCDLYHLHMFAKWDVHDLRDLDRINLMGSGCFCLHHGAFKYHPESHVPPFSCADNFWEVWGGGSRATIGVLLCTPKPIVIDGAP